MHKFSWILLNIFTFGICYFYAKHKAKKLQNTTNVELQVSSKVDFEIDDFIDVLGGKQNIINSSTTVSTLKVNLKDASFLNKESFVKFKITGFMKNANQIILVFGDNAKAIDNILVKKLKD